MNDNNKSKLTHPAFRLQSCSKINAILRASGSNTRRSMPGSVSKHCPYCKPDKAH